MLLIKNARLWRWRRPHGYLDDADVSGSSNDIMPEGGLVRGWMLVDPERGVFADVGYDDEFDSCQDDARRLRAHEAAAECVIDLGGSSGNGSNVVLPGLMDAHIHVGYMGEAQEYVQLQACDSPGALAAAVAAHTARHPRKSWVVGVGWDQSDWGRYPTRQDLDAAVPDRPVVLYRACWHIVVANSCALRTAGILAATEKTEGPGSGAELGEGEGGREGIDVDAQGLPTGILRETAVMRVTGRMVETDEAVREGYYRSAIDRCLRAGITAVQTNDTKAWGLYQRLAAAGELPLRVFLTINHEEMEDPTQANPVPAMPDSLLARPRIKLYSDGSLGAETAALREPYVGTGSTGVLIHTPEALTAKVSSAHQAGYQLEVHAIGDRAMATVLDAFEAAGVDAAARPVVTHCQVMGPDLIDRMRALGAVANIQPSFVGTDSKWVQARIAPYVQTSSYCWKTLLRKGIPCAGGSDAPVEDCDPLQGIYDAMRRRPHALKKQTTSTSDEEAGEKQVFLPEERLSFAEALWLYTGGAAYACRAEDRLGRIEPGCAADFVVLDRDVTGEGPADEALLEAKVEQVWVAGRCRWDRAAAVAAGGDGQAAAASKLDGPFIPGKNGRWPRPRERSGALLPGKRLGAGCCGR